MTVTEEPTAAEARDDGPTVVDEARSASMSAGSTPLPASLTDEPRLRLTALVASSGAAPSVTTQAPFSGKRHRRAAPVDARPTSGTPQSGHARRAAARGPSRSIDERARRLPSAARPGPGRARGPDGPHPDRERQGAARRLPRGRRHRHHMSVLRPSAPSPCSLRRAGPA